MAPRHGAGSGILAVEKELAAFADAIELLPEIDLIDFVVDSDIAHEVVRAGECELFLILAHADETGVQLSDGNCMDADTIGQYARALKAQTIYLNSCNSVAFIDHLSRATACTLIYTATDTTDVEAVRFGILFANALGETSNVETAFKQAAPRNGKYRLYKPKLKAMTPDELRQFAEFRSDLNALRQEMAGVKQALSEFVPTIKAEIRLLQERNAWHEKTNAVANQQLVTIHVYGRIAALIGFLILIVLLKVGGIW